ncbi:MAG: c-type cytochrome [Bacillota bacterium]
MDIFISWATPKEVAIQWYIFLSLLLLLTLPLILGMEAIREWRKKLSIAIIVCALSGFVVLTLTDVGLAWPAIVSSDMGGTTDPSIVAGEKVYFKYGCPNCHQTGRFGIPAGPELTGISGIMNTEELKTFLLDYNSRGVDSVMPDYKQMSPDELELLLNFLKHL